MKEKLGPIVVAWADMGGMKETGRLVRRDGVNYQKEFAPAEAYHAVVWKLKGDRRDEQKAISYATREHADKLRWKVLTFDSAKDDVLTMARNMIARVVR